ncbi:MAG: efflux RND transporter periplasmic adaptor subunit [Ignavibacteriales bacterium]|nr:efflux RND transporter periplasmic adaptor subunit [Ignavibacteriales bacterium]
MNANKYFLAAVLTVCIIALAGCGKEKVEEIKQSTGIDTVAVQTSTITKSSFTLTKLFTATLEGAEQANVVAKLAERITTLPVTVGIAVKKGQVVATLDKAGASTQYFQAEAAFQNSAKDFERMRSLLKEGAIAQQMFDGVQTQYNIAKANFDAVKSMVEITAPIDGIVSSISVKVGDNANPMMPIMVIAKVSSLKAIINVGESDIAFLNTGQKVMLYSDIKPEEQFLAAISEISRSADIQSRSFEVKAVFPNTASKWLHPGMFCKVKATLQSKDNIVLVPVAALNMKDDKQFVYVVNNGKAEERAVTTGLTNGEQTEIVSGLQEGDVIITVGSANVQPGSPVRVQK